MVNKPLSNVMPTYGNKTLEFVKGNGCYLYTSQNKKYLDFASGIAVNSINGIDLPYFIAPGLIMMTMLQNSFANSASSIGQSKFQGNIVDILMAPLNLSLIHI